MRTIQLTNSDLNPGTDALEGHRLDESHYDRLIEESTTVLKPDGTMLLVYQKDALPRSLCRLAFKSFKDTPLSSTNRGMASGLKRFRPKKRDGTISRTRQTIPVPSDVVGFLDRSSRNPYCRMSALTIDHYDEFKAAMPFVRAVSRNFAMFAPDRWEAQQAFVESVAPDFVIPGTAFTTLTINRNWPTAAHRDDGDYHDGFGVMTVIEGGHFAGGELIFPKFRTAVDLRTGGLLFADVHELHGNAPLIVRRPSQRLSFVFYAREEMWQCGSKDDELTRVKEIDS
jgi:hypothetical protein